jgi:hypothetical protein
MAKRPQNAGIVSDDELKGIEEETLDKVTKTISAIKNAIFIWQSSRIKPSELRLRIGRLKQFHDALADWGLKFGKAKTEGAGREKRITMIREFVEICYDYENA